MVIGWPLEIGNMFAVFFFPLFIGQRMGSAERQLIWWVSWCQRNAIALGLTTKTNQYQLIRMLRETAAVAAVTTTSSTVHHASSCIMHHASRTMKCTMKCTIICIIIAWSYASSNASWLHDHMHHQMHHQMRHQMHDQMHHQKHHQKHHHHHHHHPHDQHHYRHQLYCYKLCKNLDSLDFCRAGVKGHVLGYNFKG